MSVTYTDFKKIATLSEENQYYTLQYGIDDQRRKSVYQVDGVTKLTRYYLGDYEEEVDASGNIRKIHYLSGGAVLIRNNGQDSLLYGYTDNQGSLTALTNESGTVLERYAYDPWGLRRNPEDWSQSDTRTSWLLNRGYTMHEHLDAFDIINMNGRVYDPLIAQFFSPDPYVQAPEDWLNYNRYGYCLNNPLSYTDPSGEIFIADDIFVACMVGAFVNATSQVLSGNVHGAGDFFLAAGIGAISGAARGFAGQAVSGAIGFGGFAGGAVTGAASGTAGCFVGGAGNAWASGANFGEGLAAGLKCGAFGAISGGLIGGTIAGIDALKSGADFWNGTVDEFGGGGSGTFLDEEIPAGSKPTATGEIAETSTNPNYGKYGMTRNGGTKGHYGIDYVGEVGDDVFSMYDGNPIKIGGSKAYGENFVRTASKIGGKTYNVDYGHMSKQFVSINKPVTAGQKIGEIGRLGNVAGSSFPTHVHIAIWRPVNGLQGFVMPWWK